MQNVAVNLTGNSIVLVIGFLLTPIIARVYGPEAYGQFAIFTALASLIQPISTLQLQSGYVAAITKEKFAAVITISIIALVVTTLISVVSILVLTSYDHYFKLSTGAILIFPLYILLSGIFAIVRGWNIKLEEFKRSSKAKVGATLMGKTSTLGYGWFILPSEMGMILGSMVAFVAESVGYFSKKMRLELRMIMEQKLSIAFLKETIIEFKIYPKYVTTNSLVTNFSTQIPIYFLASWYTTDKVGLFSLALSLITIPVNLIGTSIGAVLLPKISSIIDDPTRRNDAIVRLYKKLMYPGVILMLTLSGVLYFALPIILGQDWQGTSQLASFIAIALTLSIVSIPITVCYRLIHYEKANLNITLVFIIFKVGGLGLGLLYNNFAISMLGYFIATMLQSSFQIIVLFKKLSIDYCFL